MLEKHPKVGTSSQVPRLENLRQFKNKRVDFGAQLILSGLGRGGGQGGPAGLYPLELTQRMNVCSQSWAAVWAESQRQQVVIEHLEKGDLNWCWQRYNEDGGS